MCAPCRLILIAGGSAVGKDTFIQRLQKEPSLLGLYGRVEWITHKRGDEVQRAFRHELPAVLHGEVDIIVVKWQASMRKRDFDDLLATRPGTSIIGFFLTLPDELHARQFFAKHRDTYGLENLEQALARCRRHLRGDLKRFAQLEIPTTFVNAHTGVIVEPPPQWAALNRPREIGTPPS